jgi:hypothetical protein
MPILVANCPRCGAKHTTFNVEAQLFFRQEYGWQNWYEVFGVCRNCLRGTIFVIAAHTDAPENLREKPPLKMEGVSLNNVFKVQGHIGLKDEGRQQPPEHVPPEIALAFNEGATCLATECWNAAGAMFRLCLDLATRPMLPQQETQGLNAKTRRDLGLRLAWLFDNGRLPPDLRELSKCVREDGNDGAHTGLLTEEDAEDLIDFATAFLERVFTEPERLRLAQARRDQRRQAKP